MARTPLFRQFRKTLRLAVRLEREGLSNEQGLSRVAAVREERQRGVSRRSLLRGSALLAAGSLWTPSWLSRAAADPEPSSTDATPSVLVVGAGIAGLTCAYRLRQRGIQARVIEAATRVGGRMYSLRNTFPDGQLTELGGELIDSNHSALLNLAWDLGIRPVDLAFVDGNQGNTFAFHGQIFPVDTHLLEHFRPLAKAVLQDAGREGEHLAVTYQSGTPEGQALDRLSLAEWLESRGFGRTLIGDVLRTAYLGEYGLEPEEQSALNLLNLIDTEEDAFAVFGSSDERYHFAAGNDAVPQELARRLPHGVELGTALEAIHQRADGTLVATVSRGSAKDELTADHVVLAIPFTLLRQVEIRLDLPPVKRRAIAELGYGTNAKLICGFNRRLWTAAGASGTVFTDLGFQLCWETSRAQAGTHGILTNFLGGKTGANLHLGATADHAHTFVRQLDQVFSGVAATFTEQAYRFSWPTYRYTLGSYTCYRPGQYAGFGGAEAFPVGRLHFCGEHTSSEFSGFMNGAVTSGERIAAEIAG